MNLSVCVLREIGTFLDKLDRRALGIAMRKYKRGRRKYKKIDRKRFLYSMEGYERLLYWGCPVDTFLLCRACAVGCNEVISAIRSTGLPWTTGTLLAAASTGNDTLTDQILASGIYTEAALRLALREGHINILDLFRHHGFRIEVNEHSFREIGKRGHIALLEYLITLGIPVEWEQVMIGASSNAEMIRYALPFTPATPATVVSSIYGGNVAAFDFLLSVVPEFIPLPSHLPAAMSSGNAAMIERIIELLPEGTSLEGGSLWADNIETAKLLKKHGVKFTVSTMEYAVSKGNLPLIKWLHSHGCPHGEKTTHTALMLPNPVRIFRWMVRNRFPFNVRDISRLRDIISPEVHKWLIKNYGHEIEDLTDSEDPSDCDEDYH